MKIARLAAPPLLGLVLVAGLAAWLLWSPFGESPAAQATGPHLSATKDCSLSDGVFTFTFTVTNDGDTPLIRWKVEDTTLGTITWEFPEVLNPGDKVTVTLTKLQLPGDGLCNWAELSYRTESWEVIKARPDCCVGTPTPPPPGSVTLPKWKQVGVFTKPTLVCFQLEVKTNGFVPSPDPPEGAEQCKAPDAAGNATFTWTNLPPGDYRIVETKEVCEVKGVVQDPCTVYAPLPPIPFTMPDPPQAIVLPKAENTFEAGLCFTKRNPDGTLWSGEDVEFTVISLTDPSLPPQTHLLPRDIPAGEDKVCKPVPEGKYEICETPPPNYTVQPSLCQTVDVLAGAPVPVTVTFVNTPEVRGRMTGGGSVFKLDGARVTRGFEIHCDLREPNNIEVNWPGGNKFHLTSLTSALCTDDPAIIQEPPAADFDTFTGEGTGRLNGEPGATIYFVFVDAGEPGKNDTALIHIWDAGGNLVLDVSGFIDVGNLQAHKD